MMRFIAPVSIVARLPEIAWMTYGPQASSLLRQPVRAGNGYEQVQFPGT
jgi:hypothetical protein